MTWSTLRKKELQVGQRWRHYRGNVYRITALAIVEATMRPVVVYSLGDPARSWTRPLDEFLGDAQGVPRFVRVEEAKAEAEDPRGPSTAELARLEANRLELWRRLDMLRSKFRGFEFGSATSSEPHASVKRHASVL